MKVNYQLELEKILEKIDLDNPPKLLLHSCCGPCSTYVLDYLSKYFEIYLLYYNPNIYPAEEYYFREKEQEDLLDKLDSKNPIHFIKASYDQDDYYSIVKGHEDDREGGQRCEICFRLRLGEAAKEAEQRGIDYFTTTLSISPHKDAQVLNRIGKEIADDYGLKYLFSDFKKKDGFRKSVEMTKKYDMYRQDYCGCVFSYREMKKRKKEN